MNAVDARAVPVFGGFHGEFRKVHRASWEKVSAAGVPRIFATHAEAEIAAWRALRSHLCGEIVGSGEKMAAARSEAEKAFGAVFRRGRRIVVERR